MTDLTKFNHMPTTLAILTEEAGEVVQAAQKIVRFGIDDFNPETGVSNREHLATEIGDFMTMVMILVYTGVLDKSVIGNASIAKAKKLETYYWRQQ